MTANRRAIVLYRLEQADEAVESAQILLDSGKHRSSVSRSYYAMFYGVLALLAREGRGASRHAGVIAMFDREFVKTGAFDKEFSRWLHEAFELRQRADYREMVTVSYDRARDVLSNAGVFLEGVRKRVLEEPQPAP